MFRGKSIQHVGFKHKTLGLRNAAALLCGADPGFARDQPMMYSQQSRDLHVTRSWVVKDC